jgi:hypothetical protein
MWVPISFFLMATEFLRFMLRGESPLAPMAKSAEPEPH